MSDQDFIVGIPRCNESPELLRETLSAVHASSRRPARVIVVDNGDQRLDLRWEWDDVLAIDSIRPQRNLGCAGAWNLLRKLSDPLPLITVNADLAVAPDTFERMLNTQPRPAVICAFGFGCFLIDDDIWDVIGEFDEEFYPVYWEDTDYRYRLQLAGIAIDEWPIDAVNQVGGRKTVVTGIKHGKHDDGGYQGWSGEKLAWFHTCLEANKQRYIAKWGGGHTTETFTTPFNRKTT